MPSIPTPLATPTPPAVTRRSYANTTGFANTASGFKALLLNTTGHSNTASGVQALQRNTTGIYNTALGFQALRRTTTTRRNLALGHRAGSNLTQDNNNIYLGYPGASTESTTMRLGQVQTRTFIAGVSGVPVTGSAVHITPSGRLGILASSARYKQDIAPLGAQSQGVFQLRPVTFRYKHDPQGPRQYGLIAEEVATVYPELVTRNAAGQVETVQYHALIPLLLHVVQQQHQTLEAQTQQLTELHTQNVQLRALTEHLQAQHDALAARLERLAVAAVPAPVLARH